MGHGPEPASLDSIFAPLDPNERLPREQLIQDNRSWMAQVLGRGESRSWTIWDLRVGRPLAASLFWPPAMLIVVYLTMRVTGSPLAAFAAAGALLVAVWRFAFPHQAHHPR